MNILLDAHIISQHETGNETYLANLISQDEVFRSRGIQMHALVSTAIPSAIHQIVDPGCEYNLRRFFTSIPRACAQVQADLLHVTYHAPFWTRIPYVVTIHDVSYRTTPRYHSARNVILQNVLGLLTNLRAKAIITVSEFSKREIERIYPWTRGRIHVTYEAASANYKPALQPDIDRVKTVLGVSGNYIFWVGKFHPRKNIKRLIQAFITANQRIGEPIKHLVLAGDHSTTPGQEIVHEYQSLIHSGQLILPGYCSEVDVTALYSGCAAFVFPSLYEGFGLPVLEAMQCGAPVITSNSTALPEIAGDAALLVDPYRADDIANGIIRIMSDSALSAALTVRGIARAKQFNWEKTVLETACVYEKVK